MCIVSQGHHTKPAIDMILPLLWLLLVVVVGDSGQGHWSLSSVVVVILVVVRAWHRSVIFRVAHAWDVSWRVLDYRGTWRAVRFCRIWRRWESWALAFWNLACVASCWSRGHDRWAVVNPPVLHLWWARVWLVCEWKFQKTSPILVFGTNGTRCIRWIRWECMAGAHLACLAWGQR